jgi:hypothetical protein
MNNQTQNLNNSIFITTDRQIQLLVLGVGYLYIIPIVCVFGVLLNLMCSIVFMNKKLMFESSMKKVYRYFLFKTYSDLVLLLVSTLTPIIICQFCSFAGTILPSILNLYVANFTTNISHLTSSLIEILIVLDRLAIISKSMRFINNIKLKYSIVGIVLFSVFIHSPKLFSLRVAQINGRFTILTNSFVNQNVYNWLVLIISFLQHLFTFIILVIINAITFIQFKSFFNNKKALLGATKKTECRPSQTNKSQEVVLNTKSVHSQNENKTESLKLTSSEKNLGKMILVSSLLYALCRLMEWIGFCIDVFQRFNNIESSALKAAWIFCAHLVTYFTASINLFIYLTFNKLFKSCLFNLFRIK